MKRIYLVGARVAGIVALFASFSSSALDLSRMTDIDFAEKYAFATNRAALVETLRPLSEERFAYSILHAQTSGDLVKARKLLDEWAFRNEIASGRNSRSASYTALVARQRLLAWDGKKDSAMDVLKALSAAGIVCDIPDRIAEVAPDMYPSSVQDKDISFEAFRKSHPQNEHLHLFYEGLEDDFKFLAFAADMECKNTHLSELAARKKWLPDSPGVFEHIKAYLLSRKSSNCFRADGTLAELVLRQLFDLAAAVKGTGEKDFTGHSVATHHYGHADYVKVVLSKIAPGADSDTNDRKAREEVLKRRVAFVKSQAERAQYGALSESLRELLEFYASAGDFAHSDVFFEYLVSCGGGRGSCVPGDELIAQWLEAEFKSGKRSGHFGGYIEPGFLRRKMAECALLSGSQSSDVDISCLGQGEFEKIRSRVELLWHKSNKRVFSASDDVVLGLDVKNAPQMRIAVYELDAFDASRALDGEIHAEIDLDSAVPTFERTVEYDRPSIVRHSQTLAFPELKEAGVYVVEVSAQGVASRALVRKGRLRVVERKESSGHVFSPLNEDGSIAKGAVLWLDGHVFKADGSGEIYVPFAPSGKEAGRKTAIVGAGRLAAAVGFDHDTESYRLEMDVVRPVGAPVAGKECALLIRPALRVSGANASLEIMNDVTLDVTLEDFHGRSVEKSFADFKVSDSMESVCRFVAPENLCSVEVRLEGSVKRMTDGKIERLSCVWKENVNGILATDTIEQLFMRRTSKGHVLECRGRTGERIPSKTLELAFKHIAFKRNMVVSKKLQFDANGEIRLGELADIESVSTKSFGGYSWNLTEAPDLPAHLVLAEGEDAELPLRGLLDGRWPGAGELKSRVSLLAVNGGGQYTDDCISACSYDDGVLKVRGLKAGDYILRLRTRSSNAVRISVVRTKGVVGEGSVVAGDGRVLSDCGTPGLLRIQGVKVVLDSVLEISLANSVPDARVHIFAERMAGDCRTGLSPAARLAAATRRTRCVPRTWRWDNLLSCYISGRNLGDKLSYVLERRRDGGRIGNMLDHPSLILNPRMTTETDTQELKQKDADGWDADMAHEPTAPASVKAGANPGKAPKGAYVCIDFMAESSLVLANLKPDANGRITADISAAKGMQDILVVVTDGSTVDSIRLRGDSLSCPVRDLRQPDEGAVAAMRSRSRSYSTFGELYGLFRSISPDDGDLREFAFLVDWGKLGREEKIRLYGEHVCHELDFFLYEKDRKFFDEVVSPYLSAKRVKDFMDKWLLGENLGEYADIGRLDGLNALELCLLARRVKSLAPAIARKFADWSEANKSSRSYDDVLMSIAVGGPDGSGLVYHSEISRMESCAAEYMMAEPSPELSRTGLSVKSIVGSRSMSANASLERDSASEERMRRSMRMKRSERRSSANAASAVRHRADRQLWRPPESTKEWVETYWRNRDFSLSESDLVPFSRFWCDYADAIVDGREGSFKSAGILHVAKGGLADKLSALAVTSLGFAPEEGNSLEFSRGEIREEGNLSGGVETRRRFFEDGTKDFSGEFVCGRVYSAELVLINSTSEERFVRVFSGIPAGAMALGGTESVVDKTVLLSPYESLEIPCHKFYFPEADEGAGRAGAVVVAENGMKVGGTGVFACPVVPKPTKCDTASWDYVSQKAKKRDVLEYLRTNNLSGVELVKMGWRFADAGFAGKALDILESRGVFCPDLWLAGLKWKDSFDEARVRQALRHPESTEKLAKLLGACFKSPLVEISPDRSGVFEHREYWPVINARAHAKGGAKAIANDGLSRRYRAFLDMLAGKKMLSFDDHLMAAVHLLAQDRLAEGAAHVEAAQALGASAEHMRMQIDYLKAYLCFSRGDAAGGRKLAERWLDVPSPLWRSRFGDVVAQADEIATLASGSSAHADAASSAPSLSMRPNIVSGSVRGVDISQRNLSGCTLRAYPIDAEIAFTKNPFGNLASSAGLFRALKSAWTEDVRFGTNCLVSVDLPEALRKSNLMIVASADDALVEEKLELVPCEIDVQVVRQRRQLRIRHADGRPIPGAYVKVYARGASAGEVKFHKDGYADLRGAFDYEAVSTSSDFRPEEFAVFVQSPDGAVCTLRVKAR